MAGRPDKPASPEAGRINPATSSTRTVGERRVASEFSPSDSLRRAIEKHVVPSVEASEHAQIIPDLDVENLFQALTQPNDVYLSQVVPTLIENDISFKLFHRVLLLPIFDRMQEAWASDEFDFLTVDLATTRLQLIGNEFVRERLKRRPVDFEETRSVLFAQASEDTHTMGLSVVRSFFLDAGWNVEGGPHVSPNAGLYETIGTSHYDLLALSSGRESNKTVRDVVRRARRSSLNNGIAVCVGGASVIRNPSEFDDVGADVIALDVATAVAETENALAHNRKSPVSA